MLVKKIWRKLVICAFFTFAILQLFASESYTFAIEPFFGMRSGLINESLYVKYNDDDLYELSRLEWELKPLAIMGGRMTSSFANFFLSFQVIGGKKGKTGVMRDYDYENFDGKLTKFSESEAQITKYTEILGNASYEFFVGERFSVLPQAGFTYNTFAFDAIGGYYQYPQDVGDKKGYWSEDLPKKTMPAKPVVSYHQKMWYATAGLKMACNFEDIFSLEAGFSAAPHIWAEMLDEHHLREIEFEAKLKGGYGLFGDLRFTVALQKSHALSLFAGYSLVQNPTGSVYMRNLKENGTLTELVRQASGTQHRSYTLGFSYKLTVE